MRLGFSKARCGKASNIEKNVTAALTLTHTTFVRANQIAATHQQPTVASWVLVLWILLLLSNAALAFGVLVVWLHPLAAPHTCAVGVGAIGKFPISFGELEFGENVKFALRCQAARFRVRLNNSDSELVCLYNSSNFFFSLSLFSFFYYLYLTFFVANILTYSNC